MNDNEIINWVMKKSFADFRQLQSDDDGADLYIDGEKVGTISHIIDDYCYINHSSGTQEMKPFMEAQYIYLVPIDPDEEDMDEHDGQEIT